jgi:hypothetical protein
LNQELVRLGKACLVVVRGFHDSYWRYYFSMPELFRSGEVQSYEHELEHLTALMVHNQL